MFSPTSCGLLALFFLSSITSSHAVPWVERHGMSGTTLQSEFDLWTTPPYNLRMTRISGSETSGQARFAAIFERSTKTSGWVAYSGMTASSFTSTHDDLHANGFRLIWLDGYGVGTTAYYNGIWEQTFGATQRVRLGESLASHQSANTANAAAGYGLVDVCAFSVDGTPYHAATWTQGIRSTVEVRYALTSAQYQTEFNAMSADGYYLWRVSGFESSTAERFTGVWRPTSVGEGWTYHGMSATDFNAHNINAQSLGYRPVAVEAYNLGTDTYYNAIWIRNGGLSTSRLGTIATAVQNYMSARNLPGLSLAIAREGRLVYARGFGYADTSDAEVASAASRIGLVDFWAPSADPDDDGRSNALEAHLGSDPLTPDASRWSSTYFSNGELVLRWTRKSGSRGAEAAAEWSPAVSPWSPTAATIVNRTDLITRIGYSIQEAKVAIPRGVNQRFLRLNMSVP